MVKKTETLQVQDRKVNWLSRLGHTALLILLEAKAYNKTMMSTPRLMKNSELEVSYQSLASGLSELEILGLVYRGDTRIEYDNGMASRTFKATRLALDKKTAEYLANIYSTAYADYSVEQVGAIATTAYMHKQSEKAFSVEEYLKYYRRANSTSVLKERTPLDAGVFVAADEKGTKFIFKEGMINDHVVSLLFTADALIERSKTWNKV